MDTRVPMQRDAFMRLEGLELLKFAFPEELTRIAGKPGGGNLELKWQIVQSLTRVQRSLFFFVAIYVHNVCGWKVFFEGFSDKVGVKLLKELLLGIANMGDTTLNNIVSRAKELYLADITPEEKISQLDMLDSEYDSVKEESLAKAIAFAKAHCDEIIRPISP